MHVRSMVVALSCSLLLISCGGSGGSGNNSPTSPSPTSGGSGSTVVTVNIMGDKGALSFSPNPATIPSGQMVVWRNVDTVAHRVVIEGLADTREIAPGASSSPQPLGGVSKGYHCTIHPGMVGSLNEAATPDPCNDYGYGCR